MYSEALHETKRAGNRTIRHDPHEHVRAFGRERRKVPKVVMGSLGLREIAVRLLFRSVNDVGELDGILNEENWNVVPDDVPIALLCVEFDREASNVPGHIRGSFIAGDCREPYKGRRLLARSLK